MDWWTTKIYICLTCVKYMKTQKLPPMSTMNGLQLKGPSTGIDRIRGFLDSKDNNIPKDIPTAEVKMDSTQRSTHKCSC